MPQGSNNSLYAKKFFGEDISTDLNQINLTWNNPDITGSSETLLYTIEREWDVGDQIYTDFN